MIKCWKKEMIRQLAGIATVSMLMAAPLAARAQNLEWASGSPGGSWYTIVTGLSNIIMEKNPGLSIRIVPGGGRDNPSKIEAGLSQMGMGIDFLAAAAQKGADPYENKPHSKLRSMGTGWGPAEFHIIVPVEDKRTLAEILKDPKSRIGTTPRATSEELTLRRSLTFYGNSPEKLRAGGGSYIGAQYNELISAYQDGQVDVVWAAGSAPTGVAMEIQNGRRASKLLPFPAELMEYLAKAGYGKGNILAKTYSSIQPNGTAVPVAVMETLILVSADVSTETVYRITKTLIENRSRFGAIHNVLSAYDPALAWKDQPVPLHPGAEKAYRELGFMK